MKRILLCSALLLIAGCTNAETNSSTPEAQSEIQAQDIKSEASKNTVTLTEQQAMNISEALIENVTSTMYSGGPQYEGDEDYSDEKPDLSPYATDRFIEKYFNDDLYFCEGDDCTFLKTPSPLYFGWNPTVHIVDNEHFESNAYFNGYFVSEDYESYEQTVSFVFEDGDWKVDDFSIKRNDMNLTMNDIEKYLSTQAFTSISDLTESSIVVDRVAEPAAQFVDDLTDRKFYVVLRTGYLLSDTDELNLYFPHYLATEFSFLFDDSKKLIGAIDRSAAEIDQLVNELETLDQERIALHDTYDTEAALEIHGKLIDILTRTYNYYVQFYDTTDGVNILEQSFKSWRYNVDLHYEAQGYNAIGIEDMSFDQLMEELYIVRNQIYNTMYEETQRME